MQVTEIITSEPKVVIEMTLSELKQLRDIVGAFSGNELQARLQQEVEEAMAMCMHCEQAMPDIGAEFCSDECAEAEGMRIHPNFKEFAHRTYNYLYSTVSRVVRLNPGER